MRYDSFCVVPRRETGSRAGLAIALARYRVRAPEVDRDPAFVSASRIQVMAPHRDVR